MVGAADVESAVDEDVELESGAGLELEHAHTTGGAISERDEPHARRLFEASDSAT